MKRYLLGAVFAVLCLNEYTEGVTFPPATKTKYETYLKEFDNVRGHVPFTPKLDANREKVTLFMKSKFIAAGLQVHLQNFNSTDTNTGKSVSGINLIAVLPGAFYKQSKDEVIILAAHIDTFGRDAGGVNNDGSGLVGLVTIAEDLTGAENCTRNNTVIFAAFDRSETENIGPGITHCNKSCGSLEFIKNIKTFIGDGNVKLVMVLDCLASFDTDARSQEWLPVMSTYFSSIVSLRTQLESYGDFLAISGRTNEKAYIEELYNIFKEVKVEGGFDVEQFKWNIRGVPTAENRTNLIDAFKDGDQMSFWENNLNAILLTDTCYNRGYMSSCKTNANCDTVSNIPAKGLSFMYSILFSVMKLTKKNICTGQCQRCDVSADCNNDVCVCKSGFTGNGITCSDVNECITDKPCSGNGICEDTEGSFNCRCKKGFTGNGFNCTADVNECITDKPCSGNGTCENTEGSFKCRCKKGFTGNGFNCTDVKECITDKPCSGNGICVDTEGSFNCHCKKGFTGNGFNCTAISHASIVQAVPQVFVFITALLLHFYI